MKPAEQGIRYMNTAYFCLDEIQIFLLDERLLMHLQSLIRSHDELSREGKHGTTNLFIENRILYRSIIKLI